MCILSHFNSLTVNDLVIKINFNPFTVEIPRTQLHALRGIIFRLQRRTALDTQAAISSVTRANYKQRLISLLTLMTV